MKESQWEENLKQFSSVTDYVMVMLILIHGSHKEYYYKK